MSEDIQHGHDDSKTEAQEVAGQQDQQAGKGHPQDADSGSKQLPRQGNVLDVRFTVTPSDGSEAYAKILPFHTPTLLSAVLGIKDEKAKICISVKDKDFKYKTLLEGVRDEAANALKASVIPNEVVESEVKHYAKTLLAHSNVCAVMMAVVVKADGGDIAGGFGITTNGCTQVQLVELVNAADASLDEIVTKAGLHIPGRREPQGQIVKPTVEEIRKLG